MLFCTFVHSCSTISSNQTACRIARVLRLLPCTLSQSHNSVPATCSDREEDGSSPDIPNAQRTWRGQASLSDRQATIECLHNDRVKLTTAFAFPVAISSIIQLSNTSRSSSLSWSVSWYCFHKRALQEPNFVLKNLIVSWLDWFWHWLWTNFNWSVHTIKHWLKNIDLTANYRYRVHNIPMSFQVSRIRSEILEFRSNNGSGSCPLASQEKQSFLF